MIWIKSFGVHSAVWPGLICIASPVYAGSLKDH